MTPSSEWIFRLPHRKEGADLYELVAACPPLDLNSCYLYFLCCDHFRESTVVVEQAEKLRGCITAYQQPDHPNTLFVWQVAVHETARGQGLASRMLDALIARPALSHIRWIETTISPSNQPSRRLFASWAATHQWDIHQSAYIAAADFPQTDGSQNHEAECLFRIGPISPTITPPEQEKKTL